MEKQWTRNGLNARRKAKLSIVLLLIGLGYVCSALAAEPQTTSKPEKHEIRAGGLTYIYEGDQRSSSGKITIRNKKDEILFQSERVLPPGMCSFPAISQLVQKPLPREMPVRDYTSEEITFVVLCGSSDGRNQTVVIFFNEVESLRMTSLNFFNTRPQFSDADGDGRYETGVYRRPLFDNEVPSGPYEYLMMYTLHLDESHFGFIPAFGRKVAKPYYEYYLNLKKALEGADESLNDRDEISAIAGPMLAALLSMQDKKLICQEIKTFLAHTLTMKDIQVWEKRLRGMGYPSFDLAMCKGGVK